MNMVRVGDIFEIPLSGNRKTYGQYVYKDKKQGPLIQVFDCIINSEIHFDKDFINKGHLFPPIITGLTAAIRVGLWCVVGKSSVINFNYPMFVSSLWDEKTGEVQKWFLWNGDKFIPNGPILPVEYKSFEYLIVWSPYDVVYRIETGEYPFPYGEMINNNKFTPIQKNYGNFSSK
jgi:hypothetical protein